jgi:hypothetical protein
MAGAGYKLFNTGDVLTAAQVNTYLMEQTVMVFADASARTTALTGVVAEGMISFLKDTNSTEYYSGSAWVAVGGSVPTSYGYAAGKNLVLNSDFGIWQRGTSFTSTNGTGFFGADRWNIYSPTTGRTFSRQNTGPNGSSYFIRMQRDSGNTNTSGLSLYYTLETAQSKPLAGKTLTLSFYARAGANFSAASSTMYSPAVYGTGTDQNQISGFTGSASIANQGNVLTTSWQRFTMTGTVNAAATQVGFQLVYTPVGTAGAADYMDIADVQWEVGSEATTFQTATGTIQGELAACQRYYERFADLTSVNARFGQGSAELTTKIKMLCFFKVQKRTTVSAVDYSNVKASDNVTDLTPSAITINSGGVDICDLNVTVTGATVFRPYILNASPAGGFIGFSAEL